MPAKEIFQQFAQHQLDGVMFHEAMTQYFCYLNLKGFAEMQKEQMEEEFDGFIYTKRYYLKAYDTLLDIPQSNYKPTFIPGGWFIDTASRELSSEQKRTYIREGFAKWLDWEKGTKATYMTLFNQLKALEPADTNSVCIATAIQDVNMEITRIREWIMKLASYDYDIYTIDSMQQDLYDMLCYKKAKN